MGPCQKRPASVLKQTGQCKAPRNDDGCAPDPYIYACPRDSRNRWIAALQRDPGAHLGAGCNASGGIMTLTAAIVRGCLQVCGLPMGSESLLDPFIAAADRALRAIAAPA